MEEFNTERKSSEEYEISGADRMFVERASKILEPYEGESEDEK